MPPITPVNNAPTGTITISGVPAPDLTLYATNTIADLDGLGPISYQWFADNEAIVGATASAFTLTLDQVGKTLTVQAMYTDLLGNLETVISDPTGTVVLKGTLPGGGLGGSLILGTDFPDSLNGFSGNDTIYGLGGADTIDGQAGNDWIDGGDGNDTIEGNYGNDTIYGGLGNDVITDFQGSNLVEGGAGDDTFTITSLVGRETLIGGAGFDTLTATGVFVSLDGGDDNDNLTANGQLNFGGGTYYVQEGVASLQGG
ncbi:MAG: hypothetical protein NTY69_04425, partial [Methylococcales bacterium]|nr:hypothetical protein [Methylococcales bacterium]